MPIRTPGGSRLVEEIVEGDLVLSRDERDPSGLVVAQRVEEVFVRQGLVLEGHRLRVGDPHHIRWRP